MTEHKGRHGLLKQEWQGNTCEKNRGSTDKVTQVKKIEKNNYRTTKKGGIEDYENETGNKFHHITDNGSNTSKKQSIATPTHLSIHLSLFVC